VKATADSRPFKFSLLNLLLVVSLFAFWLSPFLSLREADSKEDANLKLVFATIAKATFLERGARTVDNFFHRMDIYTCIPDLYANCTFSNGQLEHPKSSTDENTLLMEFDLRLPKSANFNETAFNGPGSPTVWWEIAERMSEPELGHKIEQALKPMTSLDLSRKGGEGMRWTIEHRLISKSHSSDGTYVTFVIQVLGKWWIRSDDPLTNYY
jgi:hypothetical protein